MSAKQSDNRPKRGKASKPVSFKPLAPAEAMKALLAVKPKDLADAEAMDEALKAEDERPARSTRRK